MRGGSDYTASLVGAALNADEIQIWTDIDGMHNNDPRVVDKTDAVRQLHFEEAAELAYFGAKILHPTCVQPAKYAGIPVRLLNTLDPTAPGTIINNDVVTGKIKATHLNDIVAELKKYGTVTVDKDMCIICVVGDLDWSNVGFETLATDAMKNIPVRMISYGGSNYNISFLVKESDKKRALQSLSDTLFNKGFTTD